MRFRSPAILAIVLGMCGCRACPDAPGSDAGMIARQSKGGTLTEQIFENPNTAKARRGSSFYICRISVSGGVDDDMVFIVEVNAAGTFRSPLSGDLIILPAISPEAAEERIRFSAGKWCSDRFGFPDEFIPDVFVEDAALLARRGLTLD